MFLALEVKGKLLFNKYWDKYVDFADCLAFIDSKFAQV